MADGGFSQCGKLRACQRGVGHVAAQRGGGGGNNRQWAIINGGSALGVAGAHVQINRGLDEDS
jgi:hypothetical protein